MLSRFNHVGLLPTPWTVACQAPLFTGFCRQEYWSGLPRPAPGDLPDPGIEPTSLTSPTLSGGYFATSTTWEATIVVNTYLYAQTWFAVVQSLSHVWPFVMAWTAACQASLPFTISLGLLKSDLHAEKFIKIYPMLYHNIDKAAQENFWMHPGSFPTNTSVLLSDALSQLLNDH